MTDHRPWLERVLTHEWQHPSLWQVLLRPIAWVYGAIVALRQRPIKPQPSGTVPIVVVGNITVGGAGKTPVVIALVNALKAHGYTPGVIMRGYGGRRGLLVPPYISIIGNEQRDATFVWSDEQKLISQRTGCPVAADARRPAAVAALMKRYPTIDAIVSDDGLQHSALARDVEVVVIDGARGFGNGQLIPAGPLREPVQRLASVEAIVVNGADGRPLSLPDSTPRFDMQLGGEIFVHCLSGRSMPPTEFVRAHAAQRIHALAGIGHPARFFDQLARLGVTATSHAYRDHHAFSPRDVDFRDADLIVMTEKDSVRLGRLVNEKHWALRVNAQLPDEFFTLIETAIKRHG